MTNQHELFEPQALTNASNSDPADPSIGLHNPTTTPDGAPDPTSGSIEDPAGLSIGLHNPTVTSDEAPDPTTQAYNELQRAFDHYNQTLFQGELPHCLITMQRMKNLCGYYSHRRFVRRGTLVTVDEIAINPSFFAVVPLLYIMQTMVHEMVHAWQFHYGKPSRRSYHNAEWADKMESIGLVPSTTGSPGGKRTGEKMSDYPIVDGPFMRATDELINSDFSITWLDRFSESNVFVQPPVSAADTGTNQVKVDPGHLVDETAGCEPNSLQPPAETASSDVQTEVKTEALLHEVLVVTGTGTKPNRSHRIKYRCPGCQSQAWGKPGLLLLCGQPSCEKAPFNVVD